VRKATHRHQEIGVANVESISVEDVDSLDAAFTSEHKRGRYILSTFRSLLLIVREIIHAADAYSKHVRLIKERAIHNYSRFAVVFLSNPTMSVSVSVFVSKGPYLYLLLLSLSLPANLNSLISLISLSLRRSLCFTYSLA